MTDICVSTNFKWHLSPYVSRQLLASGRTGEVGLTSQGPDVRRTPEEPEMRILSLSKVYWTCRSVNCDRFMFIYQYRLSAKMSWEISAKIQYNASLVTIHDRCNWWQEVVNRHGSILRGHTWKMLIQSSRFNRSAVFSFSDYQPCYEMKKLTSSSFLCVCEACFQSGVIWWHESSDFKVRRFI